MAKLKQPYVSDLQALLDEAKASKPWFDRMAKLFASRTGGHGGDASCKENKEKPGVPSDRAIQKAKEKSQQNGNDPDGHLYIKDMIRTSVMYADCGEVADALQQVTRFFDPVEAKDHFTKPKAGGYVDLNIIVVHPQRHHLCELQIHFDTMHTAKKHGGGHKAYKAERNATQGSSIKGMVKPQQESFLQPSMEDRKQRARAMRAIWKGQHAYAEARKGLHVDDDKNRMMTEFHRLDVLARKNAKSFMSKREAN